MNRRESPQSSKVVVVGQGYVGLPLAMRAVDAGHDVVGYEVAEHRVKALLGAETYVEDVTSEELAAALATGTTVEVTYSGGATTMRNNPVLAERFRANMGAYGIVDMGDDPAAGSTDMANVSWVCPTIHPDLAICDEGVPGHSILFRDAAALPRADETTLLAATLIAQTAVDLYADPALVAAAWAAFREER